MHVDHADHPGEIARIVGEIAERLCELDEVKCDLSADVLFRLCQLFRVSPPAYRLTIETLRGNRDALADSFLVQASVRGVTKQAVHCEFNAALAAITRAGFEPVADALRTVRERALVSPTFAQWQTDAGSVEDREAGWMQH